MSARIHKGECVGAVGEDRLKQQLRRKIVPLGHQAEFRRSGHRPFKSAAVDVASVNERRTVHFVHGGVGQHVVPAELAGKLELRGNRNVLVAAEAKVCLVVGDGLAKVPFYAQRKALAGSPVGGDSAPPEVGKALTFKRFFKFETVEKTRAQVAAPLDPAPSQVVCLAHAAVKVAKLSGLVVQPPGFNHLFIGEGVVAAAQLVAHPIVLRLKAHFGAERRTLAHHVRPQGPVLALADETCIHGHSAVALAVQGRGSAFEVLAARDPIGHGFAGVAEGQFCLKTQGVAEP